MIHFILYEDILIYKTKITKIINQTMNHNKFEISKTIENKQYKPNDIIICIVDLEKKECMDYIKKIGEKYQNNLYIICLTQSFEKIQIIFQRHLLVYDIIEKYNNYENRMKEDISSIIQYHSNQSNYIDVEKVKIPETELKELIILENKIIFKSENMKKENYTYMIDGDFSNEKRNIIKKFQCVNTNNIIFFDQGKCKLNIELNIVSKKSYAKPYDKSKVKKSLSLYKRGMKVKDISKLNQIPSRTIYNWIKKEQMLQFIKKAKKYDKIVKITKD